MLQADEGAPAGQDESNVSADGAAQATAGEGSEQSGLDALGETLDDQVLDSMVYHSLPEWMQAPLNTLADFPLLLVPVLVLAGYIVGKIAQWVVSALIGRLTRRTQTDFDDRVVALVRKPLMTTPVMLSLLLVTAILGAPPLARKITVGVLGTLLMLSWLRFALRVTHLILDELSEREDQFEWIEARTLPMFEIGTRVLLVAVAGYLFLAIWGIDPTAWLASAGVIGIAVGFAARDTLANLFSGLFIVADSPYKIGDFIVLDPTGERGKVTHVGMRSTRLLTRDDIEITIPNAVIANSKIINQSGGPYEKFRIRIAVGVAYGSDVDQVCEVLKAVADESQSVARNPTPRVRMRRFGDSSLDFELLCWVNMPLERGRVTHELLMAVYKRFAAEGIGIPFPQRDLHVRSMPAGNDGDA